MNQPKLPEKINSLVQQLKYECYNSRIPMISVLQISQEEQTYILVESISPALVKMDHSSPVFYEIQNILSGNFRTVPIVPGDDDYFD